MDTNSEIFAAKDAKNNFGRLLDTAQRRPVTIQKKGRNVAVVLSYDTYENLEALEDLRLSMEAYKVKRKGDFLSPSESEDFLNSLLDATDRS